MTTSIFQNYLNNISKTIKRIICILLDNASSHKKDNLTIPSNIVLIYLPPNCTSLFQPLDLGIIHSLKAIYRDLLRNQYYMEFFKAGNWTQSNNKDAIINIVSASQKLTTDTVINCWENLHC